MPDTVTRSPGRNVVSSIPIARIDADALDSISQRWTPSPVGTPSTTAVPSTTKRECGLRKRHSTTSPVISTRRAASKLVATEWCACAPDDACAVPQVRTAYKVIFWIVTALVLIALVFPYLMPLFY